MWIDVLYIVAGLFYTLCLELFVLFMMVCFQAFPSRFFIVHQRMIGTIPVSYTHLTLPTMAVV